VIFMKRKTNFAYFSTLLSILLIAFPSLADSRAQGVKKVLYIRVDFPDFVGEPVSEAFVLEMAKGLNQFYEDNSNGKLSLQVSVTPVVRTARTLAHYAAQDYNEDIINDARAAAKAAGFDTAHFDLDIVAFKRNDGGVGGVGAIGAKGLRLFGDFSLTLTVHEMGHNFGLGHAKRWVANDLTVLGPGQLEEYGNPFDWMGGGGGKMARHFNARFKNVLGWIPDSNVQTVTDNGIYRVNAHDFREASGVRALKVPRDKDADYWIEFRQALTDLRWPMNGAIVMWCPKDGRDAYLEDMTPGTKDAGHDAPLIIGQTFSDWEAGVHITPIRKGGTTPESLDVLINRGRFIENQPPQIAVRASALTALVGQGTDFTAVVSDPDGDPVYCYWDFDDDGFAGGSSSVSHIWKNVREHVVRCTATDGKGGTASASILISVNFENPDVKSAALYRISGRVLCAGAPLADVLVQAGSASALSNSDGTYTLANLPAGPYTVRASKPGYKFSRAAFPAGLLGPSAQGVNLDAIALEKAKPELRIEAPLSGTMKTLEAISGTADDNPGGSGVAEVEVLIQRGDSFWNGVGWGATRTPLKANLQGRRWRYQTGFSPRTLWPGSYLVTALARDRAGNASDAGIKEETNANSTALYFDGVDDYLALDQVIGLSPGNTICTVEAWVRLDSPTGTKPWLLLLGSEGDGALYWLVKSDGKLRLGVWGGAEKDIIAELGTWNHIATTFDGNTLSIYFNGRLVVSTPARLNLRGVPLTVGKAYLSHGYFQGGLRDVRLWNMARNAEQIQGDMLRSGPVATNATANSELGLLLHWKLEENGGVMALDASSKGNVGRLVNGPAWLMPNSIKLTIVPTALQ
jgi:hypothetical protein